MSPGLLKKIVTELSETLLGGIISRIHQPDERTLVFKVFKRGRSQTLLISTHARFSRMHLTEKKFENPPAPKRFCAFLRSRIEDAVIGNIRQIEREKIVRIELRRRTLEGPEYYLLSAELTGKSGNVILLDKDGVVLDALKYFPEGSQRVVMPGAAFSPLPPLTPHEVMEKEEVLPEKNQTWNEAAERYYSGLVSKDEFEGRKRFLNRAIKDAKKRAGRKLGNLLGDREKARENTGRARLGELLLANFKRIKKGMKELEVEDIYRTPLEKIKIPLNPALSPQDNANRFFKLAKKGKRALSLLSERVPELEREIEYLDALAYEWENMETEGDISALKEELIEAGYLKEVPGLKKAGKTAQEPVRRFTTAEGFEILCGKSGMGNDLIVRKYSRPDDLWFHAKGVAGAHVLLKAKGRKIPAEDEIEKAASVAAFFSKAKESKKVEVVYTEAKNVKKPKGAKPGMVVVKEYRTIVVRPDAALEKRE